MPSESQPDATANDSLQIIATGPQEDIEFNLKVKDSDDDIDSIGLIELGTTNANTIANINYRDEFEDSNSGWSSQNGFINNDEKLQIRKGDNWKATKTFQFGQDNALKQVNVFFDAETGTNWETSDNDRFRVRANGTTVLIKVGDYNQEADFAATLDTNGELTVEIQVYRHNNETLRTDTKILPDEEFVETSFLAIFPM